MRKIKIVIASILMISCVEKINLNFLIGSWKLQDVDNKSEVSMSDKLSFFSNNSFSIEITQEGKIVSQMEGIYRLDTITNQLEIIYENKDTSSFKIVHLTAGELELLNQKTKRIDRYLRY
jgi:hypothetical protein